MANPPTATGGGGGAAGKAKPSDLNFSHRIDLASPLLIKACASGQHLKDAVITVQKAGSAQQQFLIVKLADILVTSVQPSVEVSENCLIENVALSFAKIEFVYKEQKPDGTLGSGDKVVWDIKINKVS